MSADEMNNPTLYSVMLNYQRELADMSSLAHAASTEHLEGYNDVLHYLASKGMTHKSYKHYATRNRIQKILKESALYLTDGASWNDKFDRNRFNPPSSGYKHFGTCFSVSPDESIAMWMLYGGTDGNGAMIDFNRAVLSRSMEMGSYDCGHFESGSFVKTGTIDSTEINLRLVDVLYFRTAPNSDDVIVERAWRDKRARLTHREFAGIEQIAKHCSWSYEREARLVARVSKLALGGKFSQVTSIKIPLWFPEGFQGERVYDSPVSDGKGCFRDSQLLDTVDWDFCRGCSLKGA